MKSTPTVSVDKWVRSFTLLVLALLWTLSAFAEPNTEYFAIYFGHQDALNTPRSTHTFATFIEVEWAGEKQVSPATISQFTISWGYAPGRFQLFKQTNGESRSLKESIQRAMEVKHRVILGPYQIQKELYDMALVTKAQIDEGRFDYQGGGRRDRCWVKNCFQMVSDINSRRGFQIFGKAHGIKATIMAAQWHSEFFIDEDSVGRWRTHEWLLRPLRIPSFPRVDLMRR